SGKSNITSINLTTYASHQIYIESTGNTQLEQIYPTVGNRTQGIRVWNLCHSGYDSVDFYGTPGRYADFITHLGTLTGREPHVLIATGYNDPEVSYLADTT